jgi:hypothetical protein
MFKFVDWLKKNLQQFGFPQIKKKCSDSSIKQLIFHWHFNNDRPGMAGIIAVFIIDKH